MMMAGTSTAGRGALRHLSRPRPCSWTDSSGRFSTAPPPDPPKSKAGSRIFMALFGTAALTTATVVYSKNNPEVRDIVKDYLPFIDDTIAIVYGERETPVSRAISTIADLFPSGSEPEKPVKRDPIQPIVKKTDIAGPFASIPVPKPKPPPEDKPKPKLIEKAAAPEDMASLEKAGDAAIRAYKRATETLKQYARKVDIIMSNTFDEVNRRDLDDLRQAFAQNDDAEKEVQTAKKRLQEVLGGSQGPKAEQIRSEIKRVQEDYEYASATASITRKYMEQVEQARNYFVDELQALFPDSNINEQKLDLKGANADALLLLAMRRINLYQQMLANNETILNRRVESALSGTEDDIIRAKIEIALDKERQQLALLYQKKETVAQGKARQELETELKKQLDIHTSHLNDALEKRAKEAVVAEKQAAEEKLEQQRIQHEQKLAAILGRLQGVDDALRARSDADKMARQSQKLWAACEALESAMRKDTYLPISLKEELESIASVAAESDELVSTVLRCVPKAIKERGVYSELALKERYNEVENECRKIALVPEEGGGLPLHFMSWLQSKFIINSHNIPRDELNNQPTDFSQLDTYEILQRTGYWVDRCNWTQALKYARLLKGAPKCVVQDWANEVTLHLEARQAARVLLAHASASGLLYL